MRVDGQRSTPINRSHQEMVVIRILKTTNQYYDATRERDIQNMVIFEMNQKMERTQVERDLETVYNGFESIDKTTDKKRDVTPMMCLA